MRKRCKQTNIELKKRWNQRKQGQYMGQSQIRGKKGYGEIRKKHYSHGTG